jgi:fatty acid desaturase
MNMLMLFVVIAVVATAFALIGGIVSMAVGHEVGHRTSTQWMNLRVACQGAALALILMVLLSAN